MIDLLDKAALISIARFGDQPIAFLVGAPLSGDPDGGVPGVTPMLALVREEINSRAPSELPRFDAQMTGKSGGKAYQEAMKWLQGNLGPAAVNRVVESAVLKARKSGTDPNFTGNGKDSDWHIPVGTQQLAQLVCRELKRPKNRFPGPILTTNFDPLLSLAIESYGARALSRIVQADGKLADVREKGAVEIIHLHGFWRGSDTLHTAAQLTSQRPQLRNSLRRILKQKTLIVAAYGGWDDVFARTLAEVAADDEAQVNVLWCFQESEAATVEARYKELFERVTPAITRGRFLCYGDIDCQSIFGEIAGVSASALSALATARSPLAGWELIDTPYFGGLSPLRPEEVIRYFDGAIPTWRHAICADIPSRSAVDEIVKSLAATRSAKEDGSLLLIRGAGGEGKTTILLQSAAAVVKGGDWNVLWRQTSRVGLPPEHVAALDPTKKWLIVADEAENLVREISESARLLHADGSSHVHFLLAARDTDWLYFSGDRQPWGTWLKRYPDILLRELMKDDASRLVEAWRKYGSEGLRDLESLPDPAEQTEALLTAVHGAAPARDEGSFFGGLLAVRFGPDGLRNHVVSLLTRLKDEGIAKSESSLFDALVYVAACHAVGVPGIDENVLADLVGVPREWVQTFVVNPLGEEAAAVRSAGHVLTRHSSVAAAILVAAEEDIGADIAEVWSAIVRQTVGTGLDIQMDRVWFSNIVHAGPRLQRELPRQFTDQRRKEIAIAAAKADIASEPDRLSPIVDLGKTYRNAGDAVAAAEVFRQNASNLSLKEDYHSDVRGYWYEWAVAEGQRGNEVEYALANAWLGGLSLADFLKRAPISHKNGKLSCAGLGVAFGKLAKPQSDCPFALARRAAAYLGRLAAHDPKTLGYLNKHDRDSDEIGTPRPTSIGDAIEWLTTGVAQAGLELHDPFLKALLNPGQVSFTALQQVLGASRAFATGAKKYSQSPTAKVSEGSALTHQPHTRPTLINDLFSEETRLMREAVERVAKKAWEAASAEGLAEERLRQAKHEAMRLITMLSPHIRPKVSHHFTSQKWIPLIEREPNP